MRQRRWSLSALLVLIAPFTATHAGPKVVEESFRLRGPGDSNYFGVSDLALDGNRLAVVTQPHLASFNVWLYERTPNSQSPWSAPIQLFSAGEPQSEANPTSPSRATSSH